MRGLYVDVAGGAAGDMLLAALLSMISSCAPGVACVNVDDGVGAGTIATMIARQSAR